MSEQENGSGLTVWERRGVVAALLVLAAARFIWPGLPIDATFIGLLGLAFLAARWDIESLEFLGVKARRRARRLEEAESRIKGLPPPSKVRVPKEPEATRVEASSPDWYARASAAATDLDLPAEPIARILWSAEQIRIELIVLAGNAGSLKNRGTPWVAYRPTELAAKLGTSRIPGEILEAIRAFLDVRNRVAHGHRVAGGLLESAEMIGLTLVSSLRSIPREWVRVVQAGIPIFADRARTLRHSTGVMIVQLDNDGSVLHRAVYPGTGYFPEGAFVTWEWDDSRGSDREGWYMDPASGEPTLAWSQSLFFAGRPYPDEWGLMYRFPHPDVGLE